MMTETSATLLIPDISGFTEFMSNTELTHGSHAINILIHAIVNAVGEEYEIIEIEGDAVLMIKKGPAPSKKEIWDICLKIFNAFHYQRKWLQQHAICPCKACQEIKNLTLKFVVHHGQVGELKVGRFVNISGTEVIVAHRLMKNSVPSNEYLLITEKLLQQAADSPEVVDMEWICSSEEYASIGRVDYRFALLQEAKTKVPDPPKVPNEYYTDDTPYYEIPIAANFRDVYMMMMNIPGRSEWMPGLQKVEQEGQDVFVGSIHYCTFENNQVVVSPLQMALSNERILYAESCRIEELNLSLVHEFVFKNIADDACVFGCRFMNPDKALIPQEVNTGLLKRMQEMAEHLKAYFEK